MTKLTIKIKGTTASELCQIHESQSASAGKNSLVVIKKQRVFVPSRFGNGKKEIVNMPYYTGNSIRGKLRRVCLEMLLEKIVEKDLPMPTVDNFNLMNAGGGNNYQAQDFKDAEKARELNPLVSVFGASLAISGKISTPNWMPYKNVADGIFEYYTEESENGVVYCPIIAKETFIKSDDILSTQGNSKYLSTEDRREWIDKVDDNNKKRSIERKSESNNEKTKKEGLKGILDREYIVRGVDFYGAITESEPMTAVERGMIYKAVEKFSLMNLGANIAKGFGAMDYSILLDEKSELETKNNEYLKSSHEKINYSKEVVSDISAFEKWLNELKEDNYKITDILK